MDHTYDGKQPYVEARPLRLDEVPLLIDDYRKAARNSVRAGFDGAQIHSANGYLIDQFLRDSTNFRTDVYGGPIENRIRLLQEITEAVAEVLGADRTSVRLSPNGDRRGVNDSNPEPLFEAAAKSLSDIGIAFLDIREPGYQGTFGRADRPPISPLLRRTFKGPLVLNTDYSFERAQSALAAGDADAIGFGRMFISNPDLPRRFAEGLPIAPDDMATWYTSGLEGYIDYPAASA
jgi:2,4-dienoyl-CoA reductase-like NADH-dependent reductase (Old Yellow Enzyme family)